MDWKWFAQMWGMRVLSASFIPLMIYYGWDALGWVIAGERLFLISLAASVFAAAINMNSLYRSFMTWTWRGQLRATKGRKPG